MNERLICVSGEVGQVGQTLGAGEYFIVFPFEATLVYACFNPSVDDAGLTAQIQDDGTNILSSAVACATAGVPGTWVSKHFNGTNDPISIAANSEIELDFANAAADTRVQFQLLFLVGNIA